MAETKFRALQNCVVVAADGSTKLCQAGGVYSYQLSQRHMQVAISGKYIVPCSETDDAAPVNEMVTETDLAAVGGISTDKEAKPSKKPTTPANKMFGAGVPDGE